MRHALPSMARVLIVGCGYVGGALGVRLLAQGHEVFGMRREGGSLPEGVRAVVADVTRFDSIGALPEKIGAVVFAIAPTAHDEESYRATYLDGIGNVVRALREEGQAPARVLFTSSTSVYAQSRGEWVDEESPTHPMTFTGETQLSAERLVAASGWRATAVRLGGIYGPGRGSLVERLRAGKAPPAREGVHYTNRIHRDDAAGILAHLLEVKEPAPLYIGVDCEPVSQEGLWRWLADELRVPLGEAAEPPTRTVGSKRCRNDLLLSTGYRFRYPTFREGYRELLTAGDGVDGGPGGTNGGGRGG